MPSSPVAEAVSRREALCVGAGLVLLVGLAYHGVLRNGFAWDDRTLILGNHALESLRTAAAAMWTDMWRLADPLRQPDAYYRPVGMLSFGVDHAIAGFSPAWFHLHSAFLHAASACLLWAVLRRHAGRWPAVAASAWWATLPASVEVAGWISDRFDLEGLLFLLVGLLLSRRVQGWWGGVLAALCTMGALLSKETAAVAPILILADEVFAGHAWPRLRWAMERVLPHLVAVSVYLVLRRLAGAPSPMAPHTPLRLVQDYLTVVGEVARLLVAPLPLTVTRDYVPYGIVQMAMTAAGLLAIGVVAWRLPRLRFGCAWFVLGCALPSLAVRSQAFMAERYAYLPAAGAALAMAVALDAIRSRARVRVVHGLAAATLAAVLVLNTAAVMFRVPDWRDDRTLFASALEVNPHSWYALFEMGHAEARDGRWPEAAAWYERSLREGRYDARLLVNATAAFEHTGNLGAALRVGRMAVEAAPANPRAHHNYAVVLLQSGDLVQARAEVAAALALAPGYASARRLAEQLGVSVGGSPAQP